MMFIQIVHKKCNFVGNIVPDCNFGNCLEALLEAQEIS